MRSATASFGPLWGEQRPVSPASPASPSPWHPAAAAERGASEIWWPRDADVGHVGKVEKGMCLFFGIHAYYAYVGDIRWLCLHGHSKSTNSSSFRSPWVLLRLLESSDKNQIFCSDTVLNSSLLQLHGFNCIRNWGLKRISDGKGSFKSRTWMNTTRSLVVSNIKCVCVCQPYWKMIPNFSASSGSAKGPQRFLCWISIRQSYANHLLVPPLIPQEHAPLDVTGVGGPPNLELLRRCATRCDDDL